MKIFSTKRFASVLQNQLRNKSKYYILFYKYIPDILAKRAPVRPKHFEHIKDYDKKGFILLGLFLKFYIIKIRWCFRPSRGWCSNFI